MRNQHEIANRIGDQERDLQSIVRAITRLQDYIVNASEHKQQIISKLQTSLITYGNFLNGLLSLTIGVLSPTLVTPTALENALVKIQQEISMKYPGHDILHTRLSYYYDHHLSTYFYTNQHILINVAVPFAKNDAHFDLYEITAFPLPSDTTNPLDTAYTLIRGLPDYIAISQDKNAYIELNNKDITSCEGRSVMSCPFELVMTYRPTLTCAAAIFFHIDNGLMDRCDVDVFVNKQLPNTILPVTHGVYLITTREPEYQLVCTSQDLPSVRKIKAQGYAQVTVPCSCSLHVDNQVVGPPADSCDSSLTTLQTLHPVNYPVFLSFGYKPTQFQSIDLANTSVQLTLPNITQYTNSITDLTSHQKQQGLDLDKLSNAITSARTTYEMNNLGPAPFSPLGSNKHSLGAFIVIVIIVITVAGPFVERVVLSVYKQRRPFHID